MHSSNGSFFAWCLNDDRDENGMGKAEAGQHHESPAEALALLRLEVKETEDLNH